MKRVLIIEDDDNNYVLIADLLRHSGYSPMKATSGEEGVTRALHEDPDFILLDIQLPGMDGFEVLQRIITVKDIPVIAMTSYAMSGDRERLLAAGCTGYIEKPIDPVQIIQQIEDSLGETA